VAGFDADNRKQLHLLAQWLQVNTCCLSAAVLTCSKLPVFVVLWQMDRLMTTSLIATVALETRINTELQ